MARPLHLATIPVGKVDAAELEAVLARASKVLKRPLELRGKLPVPSGAEDKARGQHRAATLMTALRALVAQLGPGKLVGEEERPPPPKADAYLFVTDVDLFTAKTDGAFSAMIVRNGLGVISVRRLREAFYRRRADANKQRSRLLKETLRVAARLGGMPECSDPRCALAPSKMLADLDLKEERYCRSCSRRMFEGTIRV